MKLKAAITFHDRMPCDAEPVACELRTPSQARGRLAERILPWAPRNLPEAAIWLPSTRPKSWRDFKLHRLVSCTFQKAAQFGGKLISKRALLNLCPFPTKTWPEKTIEAVRRNAFKTGLMQHEKS
ncbi:hypothetical protein [Mesorhizobium sp. M0213]|uniref:hypothetical protein n=1 Tax=unclassified Mesorhizobium TaxID=325217 RepID=UPI00333888E9